MHKLYQLIDEVEKTHSGLGKAIAFSAIAIKAKQCLLIISPAGCGKSTITDALSRNHPDCYKLDSVTRSGLKDFIKEFTNFKGLVVIDDLGKVDTMYSRIHTVTSFAELCYSHFISKHTMTVSIEIGDYNGSAVLNVQPPVLSKLIEAEEWEVVTQDKTLRYYHLLRPTNPNEILLNLDIDWGLDVDTVKKPDSSYKLYTKCAAIASVQWSDTRVLQHLNRLLKATAAIDRRRVVSNEDFVLLYKLMKPMTIERHIVSKTGFETGRSMNTNLLAVLVEFASWKNITIERIARDYKVTPSTVYRLLSEIKEWFDTSSPASKKLVPKATLKNILKEAGVEK